MTPHEFAHGLERIYGEELEAVVLYGSAAGGEHSKKFSDVNVLCVLREVTPSALANGVWTTPIGVSLRPDCATPAPPVRGSVTALQGRARTRRRSRSRAA